LADPDGFHDLRPLDLLQESIRREWRLDDPHLLPTFTPVEFGSR
jgi:hypothetical protein